MTSRQTVIDFGGGAIARREPALRGAGNAPRLRARAKSGENQHTTGGDKLSPPPKTTAAIAADEEQWPEVQSECRGSAGVPCATCGKGLLAAGRRCGWCGARRARVDHD